AQRIAIASIFQVPNLTVLPVVFAGISARAGVESAHLQSGFAQKLHRSAATCTGANYDRVKSFRRQWNRPLFAFLLSSSAQSALVHRFGQMLVLRIIRMGTTRELRPYRLQSRIANALQPDLRRVVANDRVVAHHAEKLP